MASYQKLFMKAVEHQVAGEMPAAEKLYRKILKHLPRNAATINNLGVVLKARGAMPEAERAFRRAIALAPEFADAHNNLGTALDALDGRAAALESYRTAVRLDSGHADARNNLAGALRATGRYEEAIASYRAAVAADPGNAEAFASLGDALQVDGRLEEAGACYDRAYGLRPSDAVRIKRALMLPPVYRSMAELEAARGRFHEGLDALLAMPLSVPDPLAELNGLPFYLAYQGFDDAATSAKLAALFGRHLPARAAAELAPRRTGGPPRVGFVSSWWHNHSVGSCYLRSVAAVAASGLEVTVLDAGAAAGGGGLDLPPGVDCVPLPRDLEGARRVIAARGLDVLVYTDIGFEPFTYFLAFTRLAAHQCVMNGHPVTTGIPAIDHFLSFRHIAGAGFAERYTEDLVALDWIPGVFSRPAPPPAPKPKAVLGLPEGGRLYVCPMMLFKLHPAFDEALRLILERDPGGRVVLFQDRHSPRLHEAIEARFRETLGAVAPRAQFLPFKPSDDFMSVLMHADVVLDSFPFGGGTTTLICFTAGTPIVTMPTALARGRVTAAYYRAMGVEDCIAADLPGYVDLAVRIANDGRFRAAVAGRIAQARDVLYDNTSGAEAMAAFFKDLVAQEKGEARASA